MNRRLNHQQWDAVNSLALDIHRAEESPELIDIVVREFPSILDLDDTVWPKRPEALGFAAERMEADPISKDSPESHLPTPDPAITCHPVIIDLKVDNEIVLPLDKVVSLDDFLSEHEPGNSPAYQEAYRQAAIKDHACVEFWQDDSGGAMICFNAPAAFTSEQNFMIHILRQHVSITYKRLAERDRRREGHSRSVPDLDDEILTRRERETLPHLLNGKSNPEIASILGISPRTAEKHVASIIEKSGAENRKTLIAEVKSQNVSERCPT